MKKLVVLACVFCVVAVLIPLLSLIPVCRGVIAWSPDVSYNDILVPISILVSFLVFLQSSKQMKKEFERKGVFEFLNKSYIHRECVVDVSLFRDAGCVIRGENRILLRELRHEFLKLRGEKNVRWAEESSRLSPYAHANQVAFNLADNLELLGEALVAGYLPFDESASFIGNNLVEDWLGCCHWVTALRGNDHEDDKRVNGELIACMAFLSYCKRGCRERLKLLQETYPQSFICAYGSRDLEQAERHVKLRVLKILPKIDFIDPDLARKARSLAR